VTGVTVGAFDVWNIPNVVIREPQDYLGPVYVDEMSPRRSGAGKGTPMKAEVRVSKSGHGAKPSVQVAIDNKATPDQIAAIIRDVYSSPAVYGAAGLRECLTCKSGIHVGVVEAFSDTITVGSDR
jgi:hypothetical protein